MINRAPTPLLNPMRYRNIGVPLISFTCCICSICIPVEKATSTEITPPIGETPSPHCAVRMKTVHWGNNTMQIPVTDIVSITAAPTSYTEIQAYIDELELCDPTARQKAAHFSTLTAQFQEKTLSHKILDILNAQLQVRNRPFRYTENTNTTHTQIITQYLSLLHTSNAKKHSFTLSHTIENTSISRLFQRSFPNQNMQVVDSLGVTYIPVNSDQTAIEIASIQLILQFLGRDASLNGGNAGGHYAHLMGLYYTTTQEKNTTIPLSCVVITQKSPHYPQYLEILVALVSVQS